MKPYSQFQKIIAVLIIFFMLIQLSGCYSTKIISCYTLPLADSIKCTYTVHCNNSKYLLEKVNILNGILSGKIDTTGNNYSIKNRVHIYLFSDSVMKINTVYILNLPLNDIIKVEIVKYEVGKTILLVGVCGALCILGIYVIVNLIEFSNNSFLSNFKL